MSGMAERRTQRSRLRRNGAEEAGGSAAPSARAETPDLSLLPEHIGYVVRRAQLAIFKDFIQTLAGVDIRPAQYSVLLVIGRNPGLTQADLGRVLAIKRANLVGMLNELERRDLARRVAAPGDKRSHALYLTDNGRVMLARFRKLAQVHEKRATRTLDEAERKTLFALLQRVAQSLG